MKTVSLLVFFLTTVVCLSQDKNSAIKKSKDTLVYYYASDGCPFPDNLVTDYGFTIECIGCNISENQINSNKSLIAKLDKQHGAGWTKKIIEGLQEKSRDEIKRNEPKVILRKE